jgi:Ca2+-binding RTX toxin-like protein
MLETRRLMAWTPNSPIDLPPIGHFAKPLVVNGTPYDDYIAVSYFSNPGSASSVLVKLGRFAWSPGYTLYPFPGQAVQINGLSGNDIIRYSGSIGANIYGGDGSDRTSGGVGNDYLDGGGGMDLLDGGIGADLIRGGTEVDTVDYSRRTTAVSVVLEGAAFDGQSGEGDNVAKDIEVILGGSANDYLSVGNAVGGYQKIVGNGGNDTINGAYGPEILIGGYGDDVIIGGGGDDYAIGEDGNDVIFGSDGRDLLSGGVGDDFMGGENGHDTVYGDQGADTLSGGANNDLILGGTGNDIIRGNEGDDQLFGEDENDRLYGGVGLDKLSGGNGNDGLFGGTLGDADNLNGGAGADRFLVQGSDSIADLTSTDARIPFQNGQQHTVIITGQNGSYTYAAGNWTDEDVETVDTALNILHQATANTRLLKRPDRSQITFIRQGNLVSSTGGTFNASAWNHQGQIYVVNPALKVLLHEVGHNWDRFDSAGWQALSGWTRQDMSSNASYQRGTGNDGWWHLTTAQFANAYARTNPFEDFAMSWEVNMLVRGGLPNVNTVVATKDAFINNMISTLAAQA